jgi:cbb3-type cytochrome oxidase maturation protein
VALIISFALIGGLVSLAVLLWALASGQYEDPDGDAARILTMNDFAA